MTIAEGEGATTGVGRGRIINEPGVLKVRASRQAGIIDAPLVFVSHQEHLSWAGTAERACFAEGGVGSGGGVILTISAGEPGPIGGLLGRAA